MAIDKTKTTTINTPEAFRPSIRERTINVLSLVANHQSAHNPGWCTYTYEHGDAPELEVLCGGVNHKSPRAGAIWRQGNLLHFGFEPSPDQMSEAGKALLVNAVCYISRFTEDRPIVRTPCVFVQNKRIFDRGAIDRLLTDPERDLKDLKYYLADETYAKVAGKSRETIGAWYRSVRDYLHADTQGKLAVDAEAQAFGVSPSSREFFPKAIGTLNEADRHSRARQLLGRYVPEGPGADAPVEKWRLWLAENGPHLFFSDTGGYRWYIDPLAKRRGIPTVKLRGTARATLAPAPPTDQVPSRGAHHEHAAAQRPFRS